jgi:hypothetical protein
MSDWKRYMRSHIWDDTIHMKRNRGYSGGGGGGGGGGDDDDDGDDF